MGNIWHDISSSRISPTEFVAVIEISKGGKNKYELDKETGMLMLDRVLYTSTHYPANYGLIPRTYADDSDLLDVLVLCQETILPLTLVKCRPIGMISMVDGESLDDKIIAVPVGDPSMAGYTDIRQLPSHTFMEISHFFEVYKGLEGKVMTVKCTAGVEAAQQVIEAAMFSYAQHFLHEDGTLRTKDSNAREIP